jgi:hypothetical protein
VDDDSDTTPGEDPLSQQIATLGLDAEAITHLTALQDENENRFVSLNSDTLSDFFAALLADTTLTPSYVRRWRRRACLSMAAAMLRMNSTNSPYRKALPLRFVTICRPQISFTPGITPQPGRALPPLARTRSRGSPKPPATC